MDWLTVFSCLLGAVVGIVIGYFVKTVITNTKINSAKASAELILEDAKRESENLRKGALIEAKDEIFRFRTEAEKEVKERRAELTKQENRLLQKEESLDRKRDALDKKENILEKREDSLSQKQTQLANVEVRVTELLQKQQDELERISALTRDEARQIILDRLEKELQQEDRKSVV